MIELNVPRRRGNREEGASQRMERASEEGRLIGKLSWSEFTAANLLPDSVYLWACDEPPTGDDRPSRSDALVAWVILITQITCHIQLILVSSAEISGDSSSSSSTDRTRYSLVSVAAAMYLMTCIAGADLGASVALLLEAHTEMTTKRYLQRKMFGLMLLLSFLLLVTASIRVLFQTSSNDVNLVGGAATVLFVADVDEKVMMVLKVIPSKWRLFWVLEVIGHCVSLALLGLRATSNGGDVSENDDTRCTYDGNNKKTAEGCFVYSWYFILEYHPLSVTLASLLVNAVVVSPNGFMKTHMFGNYSWKDWIFALFLTLWVLEGVLSFFYSFSDEMVALSVSIASIIYIIALAWWLLFARYKRPVCSRGSDQSSVGSVNSPWSSSTRFGLINFPAGLFVLGIAIDALAIKFILLSSDDDDDLLNPSRDWFVPEAFYHTLFEMWLVWCIYRKGTDSLEMVSEATSAPIAGVHESVAEEHGYVTKSHEKGGSRTRDLVLGTILTRALFALEYLVWEQVVSYIQRTGNIWTLMPLSATFTLAWTLVGVCAAASTTKGVVFWSVATYMLDLIIFTILVWIEADENIRFDYF